ncbi:hypothetical protein E3N88_18758 [Mikania micrantha]|uniref:Uncharacterized protein n=1 Tax=Mikania micrantha TaxID=192012 RepID=A0A5N6NLE6_9ASTR|nr:hypothetical protein E3N88_18758 [Mikania micrantha]
MKDTSMANTSLCLLMENLKQLICCETNPLINNNPFVQDKRPQILLLYQELESIKTFVTDMEKSRNLEIRIRDVVEEAQDVVDLFLTGAFIRNNTCMTICDAHSPSFDSVLEEIKSVKKELMGRKMVLQPPAGALPRRNTSNAIPKEEIIVGLDDDSIVLVERLAGNQKQLDVISIVGMGGLGKTTLAAKLFNDPFIVYRFHVRAWVTVSQVYNKKDLLISLLTSIDTLALSLDHLPQHLRDCYLYVGGFPEDCKIPVRRLIWLWIAEGFIHEDGQKPLEEVAEDYLMDLVDRNLLIVAKRRPNGAVKACRIHDLLRELCLKKATEENFFKKASRSGYISSSKFISFADKQRRVFADSNFFSEISSDHSAPYIRSFLCFNKEWYFSLGVNRCFHPFLLLRVLDLQTIHTPTIPLALELLLHLRHLALWSEVTRLPSSVCNLWNLQTLILKENYSGFMKLPENMANMVNLRHLWIEMIISIPEIRNPTNSGVFYNLQTISMLRLHGRAESLLKRIPNIRKLECAVYDDQKQDAFPSFVLLNHLETLKMIQPEVESLLSNKYISFPSSLKKLTLSGCRFPWLDMSTIQRLPNLEVLKLLNFAFEGPSWNTGGQFHQLKFLKLQNLDIQQWSAYSMSFPCLKRLVLLECYYLKGIPDEVGDIPTLEMIDVDKRNDSVVKSANKIQEDQQAMGNYELKINVIRFFTSMR